MIAAHIYPLNIWDEGSGEIAPSWAGYLVAGNASVLFATLAGVSVTLIATSRSAGSPAQTRGRLAIRALLLIVLGLACGSLNTGIAIILVHYGVLFLIAMGFISLSTKVLAVCAGAWLIISPFIYGGISSLTQGLSPSTIDYVNNTRLWTSPDIISLVTRPGVTAWDVLVSGYYPVIVWTGFLLLGMTLGRVDLRSFWTHITMIATGAVTFLILEGVAVYFAADPTRRAYWGEATFTDADLVDSAIVTGSGMITQYVAGDPTWYVMGTPHSSAPLDVWSSAACAVAVLGICLLLTQVANGALNTVFYPLIGAGAIPLTLYVSHLIALSITRDLTDDPLAGQSPWLILLLHWGGCLVFGSLFRALGRRGPLEWVLHITSTGLTGARSTAQAQG